MNILFIAHSSQVGGAEKILFDLVKNLPAEKFRCSVIFPEKGPSEDSIGKLGLSTHIVNLKSWLYPADKKPGPILIDFTDCLDKRVNTIRDIIIDNSTDIVITNTLCTPDGAIAAKIARVPHIWWVHEILSTHKDIVSVLPLEMFYSTVAFLSDSLFCPSEAVKKELNSFIKNSDIPIERIYNDIDIRPEPQFLSEGSTKTIVTISNISKNKGISVLLESADIVCREIPDAVFQVIGRVEDKEYYKNLLVKRNSMGLEKQFCFKGFQDDVYQFLYTSDVFVSASMSEGLGIVLLEAMNAGKPVVATESGGAAEMVVDGETGFLVPVNDSRIMAERIIALLEKPEDAMNMGRAGYERVKKNFYLQKQVDAFSELLEKQQSQLKTHQIKPSNSVSALVKNLDSIGDEYYRILSSRSWRYTAFLRHIKKMASSLRVKWLHKG